MNNEFILSGDDMEMMGGRVPRRSSRRFNLSGNGMGAGFWNRQARRVSRVVRPVAHSVLNVGAKVPLTSGLVSSARTASNIFKPKQKPGAVSDGTATATAAPGSNLPLILGAAALVGGGIYLATRK